MSVVQEVVLGPSFGVPLPSVNHEQEPAGTMIRQREVCPRPI
jgi:hypothetical protein